MARSFKVDNWGSLLLQRIQQLYERGEHCDIMLKFHTGEEIPVHRMVLHACCSFFAVLEGTEALDNSTLHLPSELTREALEPVIRFMYTGQLDIGEGSVPTLVSTAQFLDMPLLEQLLQTHALAATNSPPTPITPKPKINRAPVRANYSVSPAAKKMNRATQRQELLPAGPSRIDLEVGDSACEFGSLPKLSELLMDTPSTPMNPPLLPLVRKGSNTPVVKRDLKKAEKTFDELKKTITPSAIRRPITNTGSTKPPEAKRLREEDIESFKELLAEQKRRTELAAEQGEDTTATYDAAADIGLDDWGEEDEDEEVDSLNEGSKDDSLKGQHKSILKTEALSPAVEGKRVHFMVNEESGANASAMDTSTVEEQVDNEERNMEQLMAAAESAGGAASASPDKDSSTITIFNENSEVLLREVVSSNTSPSQVQGRMIAEVLKRNPNLVSSGKNTKLKIVQRSPWWAKARVSFVLLKPTTADEENATNVGSKPSILRQHNAAAAGGRKSGASGLGSSGAIAVNKRVSPFDNVTGPWICYDCLQTTEDGQSAALRLKTYFEYRCHLIQTHGFKSDSQACEYCGHRAVKRNHMLFHLFTVHGVPPPAHTKFPQCEECDYVALTASIMRKHLQKHQEGSENQCRVCSEPFASQQNLQQHLHGTGHLRGHVRNNPCPAEGCNREFARGMNLKAHIRTCHKDLAKQMDEDGWPVRLEASVVPDSVHEPVVEEDDGQMGQEVLLEAQSVEQNEAGEMTWVTTGDQVVQLAHGDAFSSDTTLVTVDATGTEAEALSNMATTIATSLGIPMGTATTVTTTEDGITVAYLTTSDEHGQQYITVSGDAVDGDTVALVHGDDLVEESMPQEETDGLEEGTKNMEENMMEN
ncbi:centrosome-associated zinc finger protein CP190-like [Daphnia pulicaria]|uniref:centrosome-associated zinc finger protein CP190-like n=1 Tax=Daphnia pulicaria TaxID=35523 RepID=UPI001EEA8E4B|nr:centrosome-associated zinc finger protein CP190-like [Daphnia pulicaria]